MLAILEKDFCYFIVYSNIPINISRKSSCCHPGFSKHQFIILVYFDHQKKYSSYYAYIGSKH